MAEIHKLLTVTNIRFRHLGDYSVRHTEVIAQEANRMSNERKVVVYEYQKVAKQDHVEKFAVGNGVFLAFGVEFEELMNGVGQCSTAIVEMPDGSVKNVPVENIVFNN